MGAAELPTDAAVALDTHEPTVRVDDLHITYRVYEDRRPTLAQIVANRGHTRSYVEVKAVRGVSFTAYEGEVVGVIGSNGSGKSTLMHAIAGLLPATAGAVYASSQPLLLGVNAALQKSLSGRRNIVLGGLAMGLSREQIDERMDDIIDFAGVREAIDLPLRTFSSGMRARLHFAIATAVDAEILLVDEALSVGDETFRLRSEARIEEMRENAGTVFVVSHSLNNLEEMATRMLWLDRGLIVADGDPSEVVAEYKATTKPTKKK